jgi:hypothetical protein
VPRVTPAIALAKLGMSRSRWTAPVGGAIGKVFNIGKQSVSVLFQAFPNRVTPDNGPKWSWNMRLALLFR